MSAQLGSALSKSNQGIEPFQADNSLFNFYFFCFTKAGSSEIAVLTSDKRLFYGRLSMEPVIVEVRAQELMQEEQAVNTEV